MKNYCEQRENDFSVHAYAYGAKVGEIVIFIDAVRSALNNQVLPLGRSFRSQ